MSYCVSATRPMNSAVIAPITSTTDLAVSLNSYSGDMRATMKMPAVTMVAAWISAEIGVGPSIESGSHTCSGNCALLPMAPMKRHTQIMVMIDHSQPVNGTSCTTAPTYFGAAANTGA